MSDMVAHSWGQAVEAELVQPMAQGALPNYACNLFPLSLPDALKMVRGLSRRSAQRLSRQVKIRDELRELVAALINWMHCGDFEAQLGYY